MLGFLVLLVEYNVARLPLRGVCVIFCCESGDRSADSGQLRSVSFAVDHRSQQPIDCPLFVCAHFIKELQGFTLSHLVLFT